MSHVALPLGRILDEIPFWRKAHPNSLAPRPCCMQHTLLRRPFCADPRHHTVHRYSGVTRHHGDRKGVDYQPMNKVSSNGAKIYRVLDLVMGKKTVLFLFSLPSIQAIRTQGRFVISRFVSNFRLFVRIAGFASIVF